ncbi:hypothetical protein GBA52_010730 [Prunus armeniaca]|nr:hypothetical protein GBA52_010730 [Prunus armeniaca]
MSTLRVPQQVPPASEDCEQPKKAFKGSFFIIFLIFYSFASFLVLIINNPIIDQSHFTDPIVSVRYNVNDLIM